MKLVGHNILSLDFWQDTVTYQGKTFATGTIGCDSLNISQDTIDELDMLCTQLNVFMATVNAGLGNTVLLPNAKGSALQILELLKGIPPFSYMDEGYYTNCVNEVFTEESLTNVNKYTAALQNGTLMNLADPKYTKALRLLRVLPVMAQLAFSLSAFQQTFLHFADCLNEPDCKRTPDGYAKLFGTKFPPIPNLAEGDAWMALANASVQYVSAHRLGTNVPMLVKRMHYVSFVGMFRSDLFEGLCVGHAPKKCLICGRWFLTTDARQTKYCGGIAPDDGKGRSCRQIGNLKGRKSRELATDHPLKAIYERRMNTIHRSVSRGKLDSGLATIMKKLAKDKLLRAISDNSYARSDYMKEMEQTALIMEAQSKI